MIAFRIRTFFHFRIIEILASKNFFKHDNLCCKPFVIFSPSISPLFQSHPVGPRSPPTLRAWRAGTSSSPAPPPGTPLPPSPGPRTPAPGATRPPWGQPGCPTGRSSSRRRERGTRAPTPARPRTESGRQSQRRSTYPSTVRFFLKMEKSMGGNMCLQRNWEISFYRLCSGEDVESTKGPFFFCQKTFTI